MKGFTFVSELLRGTWLIERSYAEHMMPLVMRIAAGEQVHFSDLKAFEDDDDDDDDEDGAISRKLTPFAVYKHGDAMMSESVYDSAPAGSIAIIPLQGAIMKNDYCGSPGNTTLQQWVKDAAAHPNIAAIIIKAATPGGSTAGTFEFSDTVTESAQIKPVLTFVDGLLASAGYAIVSGSTEIYAVHKTSEIGSIGTMASFTDWSGYYEKMGVKQIAVYADGSPDKNNAFNEAQAGNPKPLKEQALNPLNEIFHDTVKQNRAGRIQIDSKTNEPLTGKVYFAQDALANGLIDGIKTFDQVVERALELAQERADSDSEVQQQHVNPNTNIPTMKKIGAACAALISFLSFNVAAGATHSTEELTEEKLQSINDEMARLQGVEASFNTLKTEADTLRANATTSAAEITTLSTDRDAWKKKAEAYGSQSGATPTAAVKTGTDKIEASAFADVVDPKASHMLEAEKTLGL